MSMYSNLPIDFAISYAGEDKEIAKEVCNRLQELDFNVFFAGDQIHLLAGVDGEKFFEDLFKKAKEVIVFISDHYKSKEWTRYEWDIIKERDLARRFIPIKLDNTKILGLPSNIIYLSFKDNNYQDIVENCVKRLLLFERDHGIARPTEYEKILKSMEEESRGAVDKAYQLVIDKRKRTPLDNCEIPTSKYSPSYRIAKEEWFDFSVVRRISVRVIVPVRLSREELTFNLKHCAATLFNSYKPDAVSVLAYVEDPNGYDINGRFTAGSVDFAPFGDWGRAEEGVAYNLPTNKFKYSLKF